MTSRATPHSRGEKMPSIWMLNLKCGPLLVLSAWPNVLDGKHGELRYGFGMLGRRSLRTMHFICRYGNV